MQGPFCTKSFFTKYSYKLGYFLYTYDTHYIKGINQYSMILL